MGGRGGVAKDQGSGQGEQCEEGKAILPYLGQSRDEAAQIVGVSARYVSDAKRVKERAPDVFEHMKEGTVTMTQAVETARAPEEERPRLTMVAVKAVKATSAAADRVCFPRTDPARGLMHTPC